MTGDAERGAFQPDADPQDLNAAAVGSMADDQPERGQDSALADDIAGQGPAPADLGERPAPDVPPPARRGLSAGEVERLTGAGETGVLGTPEAGDRDVSES